VVQAAEAKNVYSIGYHSDMSKYGPKGELTAVTHQWGAFYTKTVQDVLAGRWKPGNVWGGIKDGMSKMAGQSDERRRAVEDGLLRRRRPGRAAGLKITSATDSS
jgi:basic membrane lipoprotein Med (substrate-binding protein (PBP1-ABC) superfamily)